MPYIHNSFSESQHVSCVVCALWNILKKKKTSCTQNIEKAKLESPSAERRRTPRSWQWAEVFLVITTHSSYRAIVDTRLLPIYPELIPYIEHPYFKRSPFWLHPPVASTALSGKAWCCDVSRSTSTLPRTLA